MSFGPIIILMGVFLALLAGIVYVIQHPDVWIALRNTVDTVVKTTAEENARSTQPSKLVGYRAGPQGFTERMISLDPDTLLTIGDPDTARSVKLQVIGPETFYGRRQYRDSKEWVRSGDNWPGVLCISDSTFSRGEVLILKTDDLEYLFHQRIRLSPEGAAEFTSYAQEFAKNNQTPDSVTFTYKGKTYGIKDIGVWDVEGKEPHIPVGVPARWILGGGEDNSAILVEDAKGNHDSVWLGHIVDLDSVVKDILTPNG